MSVPEFPPSFMETLREKYARNEETRAAWQAEKDTLAVIFKLVAAEVAHTYDLIEPLGVGGSGVVVTLRNRRLKLDYAIKTARPSPGKEGLLTTALYSELQTLLRLSHEHLIRVYDIGEVSYEDRNYPYYIMDYVEGVKDVDDYLATQPITEALLVRMFHRVLSAVAYIHANGTVHLDLKPGNILVTPTGKPLISDLGFAKQLTGGDDLTLIGGTEGYLHPDARHYLFQRQEDDITDKNRLRGQAPRKVITKAWDLFGLGKTFLRLLRIVRDRDKNVLSAYTRCYLL